MRILESLLLLVLVVSRPGSIHAQLALLSNAEPTRVFCGLARRIPVRFHNAGNREFQSEMQTLTWQTTSATAAPMSGKRWKLLRVLPGQTVVETAAIDFPEVRAETPFLIQWVAATNFVIGDTEVLVYPTNLLLELQTLAGEDPPGVFDPNNQLKPLLQGLKLSFLDLETFGLDHFFGKLAIFGPFDSRTQMRDGLANQIVALAKANTAIVWIQPPPERRQKRRPSFYCVPEKRVAIVIVQPELAANLAEDPQSQLNLLHFCRLALNPETPGLPQFANQP
jgi:hypothetical protein